MNETLAKYFKKTIKHSRANVNFVSNNLVIILSFSNFIPIKFGRNE